jgi:indolepyruvate ferredoxin oxidoreductase alpha subunit
VHRIQGRKSKARFRITDKCQDCRHCLDYFGCPAMQLSEKPEEGRMFIDTDLCSGCAFCVQWCEAIRPLKAGDK